MVLLALLLLAVHEGTLLTLLLIHELVIHSIVQVCIIVLLIDSVFLAALGAKFDDTPRCNELCHLTWPFERRIIFLNFFDLIVMVDKR